MTNETQLMTEATPSLNADEHPFLFFGTSDKEYLKYLNLSLDTVTLLLACFGIAANIVNIIVFVKIGFQDHVNIILTMLSLSDLCCLLANIGASICVMLEAVFLPTSSVDFYSLSTEGFGWAREMTYEISTLITVYMSVERSLCVVAPIKFRNVNSKKLCVAILLGICLFVPAFYIKVLDNLEFGWVFYPHLNQTRWAQVATLELGEAQQEFYAALVYINLLSEITVTTASVVLIRGLQAASKFRQTATSQKTRALSKKESNLIRTVQFLALMFIIANTPVAILYVIYKFTRNVLDSFSVLEFMLLWNVIKLLGTINASCNIFVYFSLSSRYKSGLATLFRCSASSRNQA